MFAYLPKEHYQSWGPNPLTLNSVLDRVSTQIATTIWHGGEGLGEEGFSGYSCYSISGF